MQTRLWLLYGGHYGSVWQFNGTAKLPEWVFQEPIEQNCEFLDW